MEKSVVWPIFVTAIGLVFVFEGVLPFISPATWRQIMLHAVHQSDRNLRIIGLVSMLTGLAIVHLVHEFYSVMS